jgi:O-antigen/teichoic acid export membrane protein
MSANASSRTCAILLELWTARSSRAGRDTLVLTVAMGVRSAVLACYLILVSRWLGAAGYGAFSGVIAMAALLGGLSGWGASHVLTQRVSSGEQSLPEAWEETFARIVISGALLSGVFTFLPALLGLDWIGRRDLLLVGVSELILFPVAQASVSAALVAGRRYLASVALFAIPLGRLMVVAWVAISDAPPTMGWIACAHAIGSFAGAMVCVWMAARLGARPSLPGWLFSRSYLKGATPYVLTIAASAAYMEVDKAILLALVGPEEVGVYSVAFRVATITVMPVHAATGVLLPRLYAGVPEGRHWGLGSVLLKASVAYGMLVGLVLFLGALLLPLIFGVEYEPAVRYLKLLAPWPLLFGLHVSLAMLLTAIGLRWRRAVVEACGLALVTVSCFLLAKNLGADAAIIGLMTAELFMSAAMVIFLLAVRARGNE